MDQKDPEFEEGPRRTKEGPDFEEGPRRTKEGPWVKEVGKLFSTYSKWKIIPKFPGVATTEQKMKSCFWEKMPLWDMVECSSSSFNCSIFSGATTKVVTGKRMETKESGGGK